jgi:hypothetical protein
MEDLIATILKIDIWAIAKIFVLVGLAVYCVFAFIVVRQVKLMTVVVSGIMTAGLRFVSWIFFLFSLFVFLFVLVML